MLFPTDSKRATAAGVTRQTFGEIVTNECFVDAIFTSISADTAVAICSKPGDPTQGGWMPMPAKEHVQTLDGGCNNYVNCASVKLQADGSLSVKTEHVSGIHFLLLDDVGTKVDRARLGGLTPTWEIETSPANSQMGFVFRDPVQEVTLYRALQQVVIKAGLCDPGANGPVRWARLPVGINAKAKYRDAKGQPFRCRLLQWNKTLRYAVSEIVDGLQLKIEPEPKASACGQQDAPVAVHERTNHGDPLNLEQIKALLAALDPNLPREQWIRAMMAVWHATNASEQGFKLVDEWSSGGKTYPGSDGVRKQWASFQPKANPVTVGTLVAMAKEAGADVARILQNDEGFQICSMQTIEPTAQTDAPNAPVKDASTHPLGRFAASVESLEKNLVEQKPLLGAIALLGQATVIYAQPNTGKTLITLSLLIEAVKAGRVDPGNVFYIDMDDNSQGLLEKCRLAVEYGIAMLAAGQNEFQARDFRLAMLEMIQADTAKGVVVVLDTLKKFVNTMDKVISASFADVVRQFCMKGGTVIALAHTNKNLGQNGKPVYSGTSDIVDDFDCAYTLATVSHDPDSQRKVVEFENIKRRGNVPETVAYAYVAGPKIGYDQLLLSVQEVNPSDLATIKQREQVQDDDVVIAAVLASIQEGVTTKMKLVDAVGKRAGISKCQALEVIERYTGTDPQWHRWKFSVGARGANNFEVLDASV